MQETRHHQSDVPSYQWDTFTITSDSFRDDWATPVASGLHGVKGVTHAERRKKSLKEIGRGEDMKPIKP